MFKSTANSEQFFKREASFSTRGSRTGLDLLGIGEDEVLTPRQEYDAIVQAIKPIHDELTEMGKIIRRNLTYAEQVALNARRGELGARQFVLQNRLNELRPHLPHKFVGEDIGAFIIQVVKERLTKPEWALVIKEAQRRFNTQPSDPATDKE